MDQIKNEYPHLFKPAKSQQAEGVEELEEEIEEGLEEAEEAGDPKKPKKKPKKKPEEVQGADASLKPGKATVEPRKVATTRENWFKGDKDNLLFETLTKKWTK